MFATEVYAIDWSDFANDLDRLCVRQEMLQIMQKPLIQEKKK